MHTLMSNEQEGRGDEQQRQREEEKKEKNRVKATCNHQYHRHLTWLLLCNWLPFIHWYFHLVSDAQSNILPSRLTRTQFNLQATHFFTLLFRLLFSSNVDEMNRLTLVHTHTSLSPDHWSLAESARHFLRLLLLTTQFLLFLSLSPSQLRNRYSFCRISWQSLLLWP